MLDLKYSHAFYNIAKKKNQVADVIEDLEVLKIALSNESFKSLIDSPKFHNDRKLEIIKKFNLNSQLSYDFIRFLLSKNQSRIFLSVFNIFKKFHMEDIKHLKLKIFFSKEPSDDLRKSILNVLSKKIRSKFEIEEIVDTNLIGGVKLKIKGKLIDLTYKNYLNSIETYLLKGMK